MNINLIKAERDALVMLLAKATDPAVMAAIGLQFGGPECQAALKVWKELQRIGEFDPDCDPWGGGSRAAVQGDEESSVEFLARMSRARGGSK